MFRYMYIFIENKGNCFKEVMRQMDIYELHLFRTDFTGAGAELRYCQTFNYY